LKLYSMDDFLCIQDYCAQFYNHWNHKEVDKQVIEKCNRYDSNMKLHAVAIGGWKIRKKYFIIQRMYLSNT
ncbi:MAG: hypothetical protein Sylvanvirus6_43, partial [Sylvanvirus sp.]